LSLPYNEIISWVTKKHYAHRIPSISVCFGLYKDFILKGVCSFGMPPNYIEMKAWKPFNMMELNRLVIDDDCPKNSASFFISKCIKQLEKPVVLISYSDLRKNHNGYIYQASNWVYTGIGGGGCKIFIMKDGTERHQRHEDKINMELVDHIEITTGKARYYYFHGDKEDKARMTKMLRFKKLPYPKGKNKKYDASYKPEIQRVLF
jgi:hypothetical protein